MRQWTAVASATAPPGQKSVLELREPTVEKLSFALKLFTQEL